jgi:hypothetical protein
VSARDRIREFLLKNVGRVVTTQEIRKVAGISEYARRIRELRDDEGMQIQSHVDRPDLKPGEYVLVSAKLKPSVSGRISPQLRNRILERNGYTCTLCGAGAGDPDPFNPGRTVRLHIDHITPQSQGGTADEDNLRVTCSACNQGRRNIEPPSETALNILARIRKLSRKDRQQVYEALKRSYDPDSDS